MKNRRTAKQREFSLARFVLSENWASGLELKKTDVSFSISVSELLALILAKTFNFLQD